MTSRGREGLARQAAARVLVRNECRERRAGRFIRRDDDLAGSAQSIFLSERDV